MVLKEKLIKVLYWSQKHTRTDMVYLLRGGFWLITTTIILAFLSFLSVLAFARWLPKENYGVYQFIVSASGLLAIFKLPGIDKALIKSVAQKKEGTIKVVVKEKMKWGFIGSFVALLIAIWYFTKGNKILAIAFVLVTLFLPIQIFGIFVEFWGGKKRFDIQSKYRIISSILSVAFLILTIYLTNNTLIIVSVFFLTNTLFNYIFYKKTIKQLTNNEIDPLAVPFGKNLTMIDTLQTAADYLDKIIIWHFLGAVEVAIYSFAKKPIEKINNALPISSLALPKLGENSINKKRKKSILYKFFLLFLVTIPITLILSLIAPLTYRTFFPQYLESVRYFQVLSILIALAPFTLLISSLTTEMKKGALYVVNSGAPILKIILYFTLIPFFGVWGIIIAILISELLRGLLSLYFFLRI